MRIGNRRGWTLAVALAATLVTAGASRANDPFHHTIPREVDAIDFNTGGPYYAPPVPYGHYAKGGGGHFGKLSSLFHGLGGGGLCHGCGGKGLGCKDCGGSGLCGKGLGCGFGKGHGCGDPGCGDPGCGDPGCGSGFGHGKRLKDCGLCGGKGCGLCTSPVFASSQISPISVHALPSIQSPCGRKGCHLGRGHGHTIADPGLADPGCGHGPGWKCGKCFGGSGHGLGNPCGNCGGKGCGLCGLGHGGGLGLGHGALKGKLYSVLHPHAGKIEYFVGPGGPVPITPGYVPYVNVVRSPRDFFSFPPLTP